MARRFFFAVTAVLGAAAAAASCTATLALDGRSCPCADGWTCCPGTNMCVAGPAACPPVEAGPPSDSGVFGDADVSSDGAAPADADASRDAAGDVVVLPAPGVLLAKGQSAHCLALDPDNVYWQNTDFAFCGIAKDGGTLWKAHTLTGWSLLRCTMQIDGKRAIAADFEAGVVFIDPTWSNSYVYGMDGRLLASSLVSDHLWSYVTDYSGGRIVQLAEWNVTDAGPDGGGPFTLADGLLHPDAITLDGTDLVWIDRGSDPTNGSPDAAIKRMPKAGGAVTTIVGGQSGLDSFVVRDGTVYFLDASGLHSVTEDGGAATTVTPSTQAHSLVANGVALYWISASGLQRLPFGSSAPTTLLPALASATLLAVDDTHVYWFSGGEIRSATNQ